jgi:hypothetical protein
LGGARLKITLAQGVGRAERNGELLRADAFNLRKQRPVLGFVEHLPRGLRQLLPIVPVADLVLYRAERIHKSGIGVGEELENRAQLLHLQAKAMNIARVQRRPAAQFAHAVCDDCLDARGARRAGILFDQRRLDRLCILLQNAPRRFAQAIHGILQLARALAPLGL